MNNSLCAIVTLIISLLFVVYGFTLILRERPKHEDKLDNISNQIRGFAFLVIAQLVFIVGMSICYNAELFGLGQRVVEYARM